MKLYAIVILYAINTRKKCAENKCNFEINLCNENLKVNGNFPSIVYYLLPSTILLNCKVVLSSKVLLSGNVY